ncbi:MAG: exodeoxyribonuclease VII small subunit [Deltaproteobacteria bacterium]|jgi:exodeoxyribonuclease VII small subunit|nr:exodeoxyribonuclease VII small subunit [Deltaproteobacteria bacterium]
MSEKKTPESFEEGLGRLEAIVSELEGRGLSLDAAIAAFEEGMRLSDALGKKLSDAEAKLEIISRTSDGKSAVPMPGFKTPEPPAAAAKIQSEDEGEEEDEDDEYYYEDDEEDDQ